MPRNILPQPLDQLKQLSDALSARIRGAMGAQGMIPFSRFMEMALYAPGMGYYSAGLHKLGASGDFVTAPELGQLFVTCLARQVAEAAEALGTYDILEIGAGSGRLAAGLLRSLPPNRTPQRYRILERSADLKQVQREAIDAMAAQNVGRVDWLERPPDEPWQGVLIANEVVDALAVERFEIRGGAVLQLCVRAKNGGFDWATRPAPGELEAAVRGIEAYLGQPLPEGYRSEINLQLTAWLRAVTEGMTRGLALFIDYGYPRADFYRADRSDGTVMCHYRHRAHDDVFFWPGLQDITAWVDFTALAEAADACGLTVAGFCSQAMFLLGCGLEESLTTTAAQAGDAGLAAQAEARQLTLPGMMGERFKVMGLSRGLDRTWRGFSLEDLRYRL